MQDFLVRLSWYAEQIPHMCMYSVVLWQYIRVLDHKLTLRFDRRFCKLFDSCCLKCPCYLQRPMGTYPTTFMPNPRDPFELRRDTTCWKTSLIFCWRKWQNPLSFHHFRTQCITPQWRHHRTITSIKAMITWGFWPRINISQIANMPPLLLATVTPSPPPTHQGSCGH